ncbi:MAG: hypothetical protein JWO70_4508 [Betaproteobacteria bacterium]|nr:hypothetical protein [Betaproteobacteria bacterium]
MSTKLNVVANFLGQGWTTLMNIGFVPVYASYLGMEAIGLIGFFASLQVWIYLLDLGICAAVNREMARYSAGQYTASGIRELMLPVEVVYCAIAAALALVAWLVLPALAASWLNPVVLTREMLIDSVRLLALALLARWWGQLYVAAIQGLQQQVWLNAFTSAMATVRALGAVLILAVYGGNLGAFFQWQFATAVVESVVLMLRFRRLLPAGRDATVFRLDRLKSIWRFAAGMFLGNSLGVAMAQTDKLVLSKLLSLETFGQYMMAATLASGIAIFARPIVTAAYPRLVQDIAGDDEGALVRTYHQACQALAAAVLPAAMLLILFSHAVVMVWSGSPSLAAQIAAVTSLLAIGYTLNGLMYVPASLATAYGWTRLAVTLNAMSMLVVIPAIIIGAKAGGMIGTAIAWILMNVIYVSLQTAFLHRRYLNAQKWVWLRDDVLRPLMFITLAALLLKALEPPELGRAGAVAWLALVWPALVGAAVLALPSMRQSLRHWMFRAAKSLPR